MLSSWLGIIGFGILGGIGKAIRDTVAFNWNESVFNKIEHNRLRLWFQSKGDRPRHIIWFLWDGWHFGDTLSYSALLAAMFFVTTWYQVAACAALVGGIFQLFFHVVFLNKASFR